MILYHGSISIINEPKFGDGKPYNDYGLGFYCTEELSLAKEWACVDNQTNGYVNKYELKLNELNVLDLTSSEYNILHWMAILVRNRTFDLNLPVAKIANEFLNKKYLIDVSNYDVVIGYRADDSYFRFAKDFLDNAITVEKLKRAMELGELGKQVVLISEKAFDSISFVGSESVENEIYYTKRLSRDKRAREEYFESDNNDGMYINDIIRKGDL